MLDFVVKYMPAYIDSEANFDMYLTARSSDLKWQLEDLSNGSILYRFYIQYVQIVA